MLLRCSSKVQPPIAGGHLLLFIPLKKNNKKDSFGSASPACTPSYSRCWEKILCSNITLQGSSTSLGRGCGSSIPSQPDFFAVIPAHPCSRRRPGLQAGAVPSLCSFGRIWPCTERRQQSSPPGKASVPSRGCQRGEIGRGSRRG